MSFYNNVQLGITRLTKTGGGTFDLVSIDLDALNDGPGYNPGSVTFIGTLPDATNVTQTFTMDSVFLDHQTFPFSELFDTVTQVTWQQTASYPDPGHQFDNIVVTAHPQPVMAASQSR